ncbi:MAG: helix-turn-helix transcriptional regulator [Actinomycetota bacterium]
MRRATLLRQFGVRVRTLREARDLSQERLGELAGLHRNYIGAVERGEYNPTLVSQAKIAKALGVSLSELLKGIKG